MLAMVTCKMLRLQRLLLCLSLAFTAVLMYALRYEFHVTVANAIVVADPCICTLKSLGVEGGVLLYIG